MSLFSRLFKKKDDRPAVEERTLMNMRVGDMVSYDLEDYEVVGKMTLNDHGFQWYEYQLENASGSIWLSVEMDDELECAVYRKSSKPLKNPGTDELTWEGKTYYLEEKGQANVRGQGRSTNVSGATVTYYDYADESGDELLSVEIWGGDVEVSTGQEAEPFEFNITAGTY